MPLFSHSDLRKPTYWTGKIAHCVLLHIMSGAEIIGLLLGAYRSLCSAAEDYREL